MGRTTAGEFLTFRNEAERLHSPVLIVVLAAAMPVSAAAAGKCGGSTSVEVAVHQAPLSVRTDFSFADLSGISAQLSQKPPHPVLGFYKGSVGYVLHSVDVDAAPQRDGERCPRVRVQAGLVATDRQIEIGKELQRYPCRFHAVLAHYRHHAAAAALALESFALSLPPKLQSEIDVYVAGHPVRSGASIAALRSYIGELLDRAVGIFSRSLTSIQAGVDTPQEVRALVTSCGFT